MELWSRPWAEKFAVANRLCGRSRFLAIRAQQTKPYTSNVPKPSKPRATNREVEVKIRIEDVTVVRTRLAAAGAKMHRRVLEQNALFDTVEASLRRSGRLVRLRIETPVSHARKPNGTIRAILTSKAPVSRMRPAPGTKTPRYKERLEREVILVTHDGLREQLHALGFRPRFRYEKYRTSYRLPGVHIELDETPVGTYLELEGTPQAIESSARKLGFTPADFSTDTYWGVYVADCKRRGVKPTNMLFR
jgi:adenylate cyclase, class 2